MTTASFFWSKLPHVPTHVRLQPCQRRRSLQQSFYAESQFVPSPKGGRTKARFHWFAGYDLPAGGRILRGQPQSAFAPAACLDCSFQP
jgi:hypothetical protein